ncbi:c-type cytochrome [Acidipila rosea]|uniref:Cbb3-type cytochrome c oxidase subunit III n=1 Tax=Acidipila rosea TaxID=768535 RepID=A0A4R1L3V1_9BACT|nr:cytochrome c [Acidipila rosea]TCK71757.1 cbb3-type cytochrome c oxidase subunit III [Acidipila rosea]
MNRIRSEAARHGVALAALAAISLLAGCRQDMHNQPKFIPQRGTTFFADGRSVRPQVTETVARGQLDEDQYFYTGLKDGKEQNLMPFPVTMQVMERGQERFNIYCTPCHSRVGNGDGMIVQRGYKPAGNYHGARLMAKPLSHFFYVMTNGYGAMPDYSAQLTPADRWAVAAYIRALQLSQAATTKDVPAGAQVGDLTNIAESEGYPASYAGPWPLPETTYVEANPRSGLAAGAPVHSPNPPATKNMPMTKTTKGETMPPSGAR